MQGLSLSHPNARQITYPPCYYSGICLVFISLLFLFMYCWFFIGLHFIVIVLLLYSVATANGAQALLFALCPETFLAGWRITWGIGGPNLGWLGPRQIANNYAHYLVFLILMEPLWPIHAGLISCTSLGILLYIFINNSYPSRNYVLSSCL